jgi:hypothetical protein
MSDQTVAEQICRDLLYQGRRFQLGEYVALLDGEVVATAKTVEEAARELDQVAPDPKRGLIFEVAPLQPDVIR